MSQVGSSSCCAALDSPCKPCIDVIRPALTSAVFARCAYYSSCLCLSFGHVLGSTLLCWQLLLHCDPTLCDLRFVGLIVAHETLFSYHLWHHHDRSRYAWSLASQRSLAAPQWPFSTAAPEDFLVSSLHTVALDSSRIASTGCRRSRCDQPYRVPTPARLLRPRES